MNIQNTKFSDSNVNSKSTSMLSPSGLTRWFRRNKFANLFDLDTPVKPECDTMRANAATCRGRSMVEMLGVLAIIGVLSVGAIAGYSKAMEKYRLNKTLYEYNYIISGLEEHLADLQTLSKTDTMFSLKTFLRKINLVPSGWKDANSMDFYDSYGNRAAIFVRNSKVSVEILLLNKNSKTFCEVYLEQMAQAWHNDLYQIWFTAVGGNQNYVFWGDKNCSADKQCAHNMTVAESNKICNICDTNANYCSLILKF